MKLAFDFQTVMSGVRASEVKGRGMKQRTYGFVALITALLAMGSLSVADESTEQSGKETIAILGTGDMGNSFGPRLASLGYPIVYGSRNPESEKVQNLLALTGHGATATTQKAAAEQADIILLALPWPAMEAVTKDLGDVKDKILIDISWPPADLDEHGYYYITIDSSSAELIQGWNPEAQVVKAFGTIGSNIIDDPGYAGGVVSVPIASDHPRAKERVAEIAVELELDPLDGGPLRMSRNIEAMMILYYVPIMQGRDTGWEFYFRRSNYFVCNHYVAEGGEDEFGTASNAPDLANIPDTHGPAVPCP